MKYPRASAACRKHNGHPETGIADGIPIRFVEAAGWMVGLSMVVDLVVDKAKPHR